MIKRAGDKLGNRCTRTNNGRLPWPCHLDLFFKRCIPVCSYILVSLTYKIYTTRGIPDTSTYMHIYILHHSSTWITPCKEMAARAATPQRTRRAIPTVSDWKSWRAETALAMKYIRTFDSLGPCVPIGLSQLWSFCCAWLEGSSSSSSRVSASLLTARVTLLATKEKISELKLVQIGFLVQYVHVYPHPHISSKSQHWLRFLWACGNFKANVAFLSLAV